LAVRPRRSAFLGKEKWRVNASERSGTTRVSEMVNLVFTGIVEKDPDVRTTDGRNTIAIFPVDVKEQPHLPPTRILVVATGKQALYAQQLIREGTLLMVSGWFYVEQNKKGNEFIEVKAKHLRALVPSPVFSTGREQ
jgi:Single-strand binding protein family